MKVKLLRYLLVYIPILRCSNLAYSQWQNEIFRTPQIILEDSADVQRESFQYLPNKKNYRRNQNKPYLQFGALQYTKNNEYFQATNPGETIMGQRIWTVFEYEQKSKEVTATYSFGAMLQYPFENDLTHLVQLKPIARIALQTKRSTVVAGTIDGHVNHQLPEPVFNYEWALKSPVEYGLAWNNHSKKIQLHQWINWRQQAIIEQSQQEIIVGGISANWLLYQQPENGISLEIPAFMIHQHMGGENLKQPQPIQNKNNTGVGIRVIAHNIQAEYYGIQSLDFSPQPLQPYKNGFGHLLNITYYLQKNHRIVGTYWNAIEFHAPLGAAVYGCVNLENPYKNIYSKEVFILRYAYLKRWVSNAVTEFRIEPGIDLKTNDFLLSFGLYFRYMIGDWVKYCP